MADNIILQRLDGLRAKYDELQQQMTAPDAMSDMKRFVTLNKEYKELGPIIDASEKYRTGVANLANAKRPKRTRSSASWHARRSPRSSPNWSVSRAK